MVERFHWLRSAAFYSRTVCYWDSHECPYSLTRQKGVKTTRGAIQLPSDSKLHLKCVNPNLEHHALLSITKATVRGNNYHRMLVVLCIVAGDEAGRLPWVSGSAPESHTPHQIVVAWVAAQRIVGQVMNDKSHRSVASLQTLFEPSKGLILITETRIHRSDILGD